MILSLFIVFAYFSIGTVIMIQKETLKWISRTSGTNGDAGVAFVFCLLCWPIFMTAYAFNCIGRWVHSK